MRITGHKRLRLSVLLSLFFCFNTGVCQDALWGVVPGGGTSGLGTIIKYTQPTLQTVYNFPSFYPGAQPKSLLKASNGKLYGVTFQGGVNNNGVLFAYTPLNGVYEVIHHFDGLNGTNGYQPSTRLMQASNGKIYGSAMGGQSGAGVLFEVDPNDNSYNVVHHLSFLSGALPGETLAEGDNSKLYGTTTSGGAHNNGVIFEFDLVSKTYTKKYDFIFATGSLPISGLMRAASGKFYGMTKEGGWDFKGGIFEYDASTNSVLHKRYFGRNEVGASVAGSSPTSVMVQHPNGKMYGVTSRGGTWGIGVLFEFDPVLNSVTEKAEFGPFVIGGNASTPLGGVTLGSNGKIYGITSSSDIYSTVGGYVYEFDPAIDKFVARLQTAFSSSSILTEGSAGVFYGTTTNSAFGSGVLFKYVPSTNTISREFEFNDSPGARPMGTLTQAYNGMLYGLASIGGNGYNGGVIFEVNPSNGAYIKKADLDGVNGAYNPRACFVLHPNGKLYATTRYGGAIRNFGGIIEFDPATGTVTHSKFFDDIAASFGLGENPSGELALAPNGKFYGLCPSGGRTGEGTLFEYDPITHTLLKKIDFGGNNGSAPKGSLTFAADGKFYGFTSAGGNTDKGILFQYDYLTNAFNKKADFAFSIGVNPEGTLTEASNGTLYGLCLNGGPEGRGTIFQYNIATSSLSLAYSFNGSPNAFRPLGGSLIETTAGKLIGMTRHGGEHLAGAIFEFNIATGAVTTLYSFDGISGFNPEYTSFTKLKVSQALIAASSTFTKNYGDASFPLAVSSTSGLPVRYVSTNEAVATVVNGQVVIHGAGEATIHAMQEGSNAFLPAPIKTIGLTVNKLPLTIKANDAGKSYGADLPSGELSFAGFIGSDSKEDLQVLPSVSFNAEKFSSPGQYSITLSGGTDENYLYALQPGTLTIEKAVLKAIANDAEKTYGSENPVLEILYEGFAGTDDVTNLTEVAIASSQANQYSDAGEYSISVTGGMDENYSIVPVSGKLIIRKAPLEIKANDIMRAYGQTNPIFSLEYSGFIGTDTETDIDHLPQPATSATSVTSPGKYPIILEGGSDRNYEMVLKAGVLTISRASQTITFALLPEEFIHGTIVLEATSSSGLPVVFASDNSDLAKIEGTVARVLGTGTVSITASQDGNANYLPAEDVVQQVHISLVTAIEPGYAQEFSLYPNPTPGLTRVSYPGHALRISLFDQSGKVIYETFSNEIDLSAFPEGTYILRCITGEGVIERRVVKVAAK